MNKFKLKILSAFLFLGLALTANADTTNLKFEGNSVRAFNAGGDVNLSPDAQTGIVRTNRPLSIGARPESAAMFQVSSSTMGSVCAPVMTTAERDAIAAPFKGLQIFNSTTNVPNFYNGSAWTASGGGGGSGTVTNVASGTGLTGGPITTTGTLSLANTAVTPGSYTYSSLTVDAQGRLTAASSGTTPANTALSNLGATNIGQSLLFNANATYDIGSAANNLSEVHTGKVTGSGGLELNSSAAQVFVSTEIGLFTDGGVDILDNGSAAAQPIRLFESTGTFFSAIKAPALAASYTLTLPPNDGTAAGQVLQTDGAGVTSFTNVLSTSSGDPVIDYDGGFLDSSDGNGSVDWFSRVLTDSSGNQSIDWNDRQAHAPGGSVVYRYGTLTEQQSSWGSDLPGIEIDGTSANANTAGTAGITFKDTSGANVFFIGTSDSGDSDKSSDFYWTTGNNTFTSGTTGTVTILSGQITNAANASNTANIVIGTGPNSGTGESGNVQLNPGTASTASLQGIVVAGGKRLDSEKGIRANSTGGLTADPCGVTATYPEATIFYNTTSDYYCFCNGAGDDVQMHSPATACF